MNTRNKLEKIVEDLQEKLTKTQQELAELDEPKLRHGDYGTRPENTYFVCIQSNIRGKLEYANECGLVQDSDLTQPLISGNIFDDLKRNSEDLRDWHSPEAEGKGVVQKESIIMRLKGPDIWLGTCGNSAWYTLDQATEIHQKLGRLIATAKRRNANT